MRLKSNNTQDDITARFGGLRLGGASAPVRGMRWNYENADREVLIVPVGHGSETQAIDAEGESILLHEQTAYTPSEYDKLQGGPFSEDHYLKNTYIYMKTPEGNYAPWGIYRQSLMIGKQGEEGAYRKADEISQAAKARCGLPRMEYEEKVAYSDKYWSPSKQRVYTDKDAVKPSDCKPLSKLQPDDRLVETNGVFRRQDYKYAESSAIPAGQGGPDILSPTQKKAYRIPEESMSEVAQLSTEDIERIFGPNAAVRLSSNLAVTQDNWRGAGHVFERIASCGMNVNEPLAVVNTTEIDEGGQTRPATIALQLSVAAELAKDDPSWSKAVNRIKHGRAANRESQGIPVVWPNPVGQSYMPPSHTRAMYPAQFAKQARAFGINPDNWKDSRVDGLWAKGTKTEFWRSCDSELQKFGAFFVHDGIVLKHADSIPERGEQFVDKYDGKPMFGLTKSPYDDTRATSFTEMSNDNLGRFLPASQNALDALVSKPQVVQKGKGKEVEIKQEAADFSTLGESSTAPANRQLQFEHSTPANFQHRDARSARSDLVSGRPSSRGSDSSMEL